MYVFVYPGLKVFVVFKVVSMFRMKPESQVGVMTACQPHA